MLPWVDVSISKVGFQYNKLTIFGPKNLFLIESISSENRKIFKRAGSIPGSRYPLVWMAWKANRIVENETSLIILKMQG